MPEYKMPETCIGMIVLWFSRMDDSDKGTPAMVTAVGDRTLSLTIMPKGYTNNMNRDGVKHIDDPDKKSFDKESIGFWGYTDWWKALGKQGVRLYPIPTSEQPTPAQPAAVQTPAKK